jgi:hypothetical protein
MVEEISHLMVAWKQTKEEKDWYPTIPFEGMPLRSKTSTRPHLLKIQPPSNCIKAEDQFFIT